MPEHDHIDQPGLTTSAQPDSARRRQLIGLAAGSALLAGSLTRPARAQTYPARPISLIVPFGPGASTDNQFRALAQLASKELGQNIVVTNKPGVNGTLGPSTMAQTSPPDGYSLSVIPSTLFRIPHLQRVSWDPLRDFSYVIGLTTYTFAVAVRADAPWKTLADLIADAKANPEKITYGTSGRGGTGHIAMERLSRLAGFKMNLVPFKGASEFMPALVGGHIDVVADAGWGTLASAGRVRLLTVMTPQRLPSFPDVPTLKEQGHDLTAMSMLGIGGPKGMDPAVVKVLHDAFRKASRDPAFQRVLFADNQPEIYMDSEAFRKYAAEQYEIDRKAVQELGLGPTG
ncbi:tripartite tricarboxylate transporter substrate binding protein [Quisquiliibacterium transsilvanicum]|uniref:Tripartite-type tricarboxylate transporter receptor subunit TctC n=1 Tax=Quisquiliibacterium transsilvanicum TaxID=1549638 RepID=A0A7W8M9W6_9BURK|nr:tripartite tricarboxylate transporter substrate binding protein [Quisquiliibacterium transsilvanicum]MBB5273057.1 tripartite-type tricarboxylate transporter receptor subunit TctC [Quisquiliibacterium transsilvanicum]